MRNLALRVLTAGALVLSAAPALANDYYVDAWNGWDMNGGTGPGDAWRTVTHALATVPDPAANEVHRIILAQATYSTSTGEQFPLVMRPRIQLIGTDGPVGVLIRGGWVGPLVRFESLAGGAGFDFDAQTLISKVTLHQGHTGISMETNWGEMSPLFEDVLVWQMLGPGVEVIGGDVGAAGAFHPVFNGMEVWDAEVNMRVTMSGEGCRNSVSLVDCDLHSGPGHGLELNNSSDNGLLLLDGLRSMFHNRTGDAVHVEYANASFTAIDLRFCELTDTASNGLHIVPGTGQGGVVHTRLSHCTVSGHQGAGLSVSTDTSAVASHPTELDSTILWGNGDDLVESSSGPSITSIRRCDIEDGDYLGVNGTFSEDPLFAGVPFNDYRLRFDSPCVERGEPLAGHVQGEPSLGGVVPPMDGDLDLLPAWDVGAREFAPLQLTGRHHLGSTVRLQAWGPASGRALIYWCREPLATVPRTLIIGDFWLCASAKPWQSLPTDPAIPGQLSISIPTDTSIVGSQFSFQALELAPPGSPYPRVLTNPVQFTVLP